MAPFIRADPGAPRNPFATNYWSPGALDFVFGSAEQSAGRLYEKFIALGQRGVIVGPHGTGKTTLLRALQAAAERHGHVVCLVTLNDKHPNMPRHWWSDTDARKDSLVFLDGAELLSRAGFAAVRLRCWRYKLGLVATSHRVLSLPVLYRTQTSGALAEVLATRVLAQSPNAPALVHSHEAAAALEASRGDMRQALFKLYDLFEQRWREQLLT